MFPCLPARAAFVADKNFVSGTQKMFLILFRNVLCPQEMFPSLHSPRNMGNNVSATECPRLPWPLTRALSSELRFYPLSYENSLRAQLWQRVFSLSPLTEENELTRGLTGWTTTLDWALARSDSLATVMNLSRVPKYRRIYYIWNQDTKRTWTSHVYFLRTSPYVLAVQLLM